MSICSALCEIFRLLLAQRQWFISRKTSNCFIYDLHHTRVFSISTQVMNKLDVSVLMNVYVVKGRLQTEEHSLNQVLSRFSLQTVCLCHLRLTKFPKSTLQMSQRLRVLRLSNNAICRIPLEIAELVHLRVLCLDFQNPKLHSLPQSISNLKELQVLSVIFIAWRLPNRLLYYFILFN